METVYAICAAVGGTILVCQFVLTLIGLGGEGHDAADAGHDLVDGGHDFADGGHDLADGGHDLADAGGDDGFGHDHGGDADAYHHGVDPDVHYHGGDWHAHGHGGQAQAHAPSLFFRMLTFRTIVAAIAFFGLVGLAGSASTLTARATLIVAVAAGAGAMYGVHQLMSALHKLGAEGTVHIQRAIGQTGTVYLTIPARNSGLGKVTVKLQDRTMEYRGVTFQDELPTGTQVVVVGVMGPDTVEVELAPDAGSDRHV